MHCIDDKPNGIILNHNADWSGDVRLAWYDVEERHDPGPTPPSLRECWCSGPDLVAGRFTFLNTPSDRPPGTVVSSPSVDVMTRAVALAVEAFLRSKMERAVDDLFIKRGRL